MPRKKERIVSLEVAEPSSTWDYRKSKSLTNFVCKASEAERVIREMDLKERWKEGEGYAGEVRSILADPGTRNASSVFFGDDVNVEEVRLPASVKPSSGYVYKVYDYFGERTTTEYGTRRDVLAYLAKRVRTKYMYVSYNGQSARVEYSPKVLAEILDNLDKTTSQLEVEPTGRSGCTEDMILVSIFKNMI